MLRGLEEVFQLTLHILQYLHLYHPQVFLTRGLTQDLRDPTLGLEDAPGPISVNRIAFGRRDKDTLQQTEQSST